MRKQQPIALCACNIVAYSSIGGLAIRMFEMTPALLAAALLGLVALLLLLPSAEPAPTEPVKP